MLQLSKCNIATGYGLDGPGEWIPVGARFSAPVQTGPGSYPASCTIGTGSFQVVKSGRGVTLTPHPLLVPWSRKSRALLLFPLWTVRPVQSLSACTRVHFTLYLNVYVTLLTPIWPSGDNKRREEKNSYLFSLKHSTLCLSTFRT